MYSENLQTSVIEFNKDWIDEFGLISKAYSWAQRELPRGHRVIGTRVLPFGGKQDIYKFDIRHTTEKGITIECEMPARCRTVIRINARQMIVQESESGEIVQKYQLFMKDGVPVWRLWHQRVYEYHLELELPAVNYNIFLLQCNQIVRDISKHLNRDWLFDMKKRVIFNDLRGNTPPSIVPLMESLRHDVTEYFANPARTMAQHGSGRLNDPGYQEAYSAILDASVSMIVQAGAGALP